MTPKCEHTADGYVCLNGRGRRACLLNCGGAGAAPAPLVPPKPAKRGEKPPPVIADCPHRSAEPVGEVECQTCRGKVELKVFACAVAAHPSCTIAKAVAGHHCCTGCAERPPGDAAIEGATREV
jgi:hypothetical protein